MTDKQIIIDDQKKTIHRLQDECTEKTNAIIALGEQLQRKQQSEEKLVKQIQTICDFINNRPETFKGINGSVDKIITDYAERKEQECERLKHDNGYEVGALEKTIDNLKAENEELRESVSELIEMKEEDIKRINNAIKLKQTLTEIKEIAEAHKKDESVWNPYRQLDKILQKISECEGNNDR